MFLYHLFAKTTCNGKEFKFQGSHEDRNKKGNEKQLYDIENSPWFGRETFNYWIEKIIG